MRWQADALRAENMRVRCHAERQGLFRSIRRAVSVILPEVDRAAGLAATDCSTEARYQADNIIAHRVDRNTDARGSRDE
jgi:hypothetical protein